MEGTIGEIRMFGGNFAPRDWALCDGQLLPINQNQALFSILGTTYGGDGRTTFALPDLRGRVPIHEGQGPGLTNHNLGNKGGEENVSLTENNLPTHSHDAKAGIIVTQGNTRSDPKSTKYDDGFVKGSLDGRETRQILPVQVNNTGTGQPANNMQPFLCVNFIICLNGVYPSRS